MPQRHDELTAFDWLILAYVAAYPDEVPVPLSLVQATLGNQLQHATSVTDSIARLCSYGYLRNVDDQIIVLPSSRRCVMQQLTAARALPDLFDEIEAAGVEQLLDAELPGDASIGALLPQARAITNRALVRETPVAPLLASLLGQALAQQDAIESEHYLHFGVAGDLTALPSDELLIHARSLVLLADLALARGEYEVAHLRLVRALRIYSQQLAEEHEGGAAIRSQIAALAADNQERGASMSKRKEQALGDDIYE